MAVFDPVGDLNYVYLLARDDQPDETLAAALERLFSYPIKAHPVSDSLRDKLSSKSFYAVLNKPPSEYLVGKISRLQEFVWHHIDGDGRRRKRRDSLPEISNPPNFKKEQLLGLKSIVMDWMQRDPIDFELLHDAIRVENALRNLELQQPGANEEARSDDERATSRKSSATSKQTPKSTRSKKSTQNGEARAKLEYFFVEHHQFDKRSIGNSEPIGTNELARKASVSSSTAKGFIDKWFAKVVDGKLVDGRKRYERDANGERTLLLLALTQLSGESVTGLLRTYGSDPDKRTDD